MGLKRRGAAAPEVRVVILDGLQRFLDGVLRRGGEGDLVFEPPVEVGALAGLELPPGAVELFTTITGRMEYHWQLDEAAMDAMAEELGDRFADSVFGGFELSPDCFEYPDIDNWSVVDEVWRNKAIFAPTGSGDYLGVDVGATPGQVVYLGHELDPRDHGTALGVNLIDLLLRWAPLGCVGPDSAAWEPFLREDGRFLDPEGANARAFIAHIAGDAAAGHWRQARKGKYAALNQRVREIAMAPAAAVDRMVASVTDEDKITSAITRRANAVVATMEEWFGVAPRSELRALIAASLAGEWPGSFGPLEATVPARSLVPCDNAFVQVVGDSWLRIGALTGLWPFGKAKPWDTYLVELDAEHSAVFTGRPFAGLKYRAASLPRFAQLLEVADACHNVNWHTWDRAGDQFAQFSAALAPLLPHLCYEPRQDKNPLDDFIATFKPSDTVVEHRVLTRHHRALPLLDLLEGNPVAATALPKPDVPTGLTRQPGPDALYGLLVAYFNGDEELARNWIAEAGAHPARVVRDAAQLLKTTLDGIDGRSPARYLYELRRRCAGEQLPPPAHDAAASRALLDRDEGGGDEERNSKDELRAVLDSGGSPSIEWQNLAYHYRRAARWDSLRIVSGDVIAHDPAEGWRYRGDALRALGQYTEALDAYDRALLYPSTFRAESFASKVDALARMGDESAARAHLAWLAPEVRDRVATAAGL